MNAQQLVAAILQRMPIKQVIEEANNILSMSDTPFGDINQIIEALNDDDKTKFFNGIKNAFSERIPSSQDELKHKVNIVAQYGNISDFDLTKHTVGPPQERLQILSNLFDARVDEIIAQADKAELNEAIIIIQTELQKLENNRSVSDEKRNKLLNKFGELNQDKIVVDNLKVTDKTTSADLDAAFNAFESKRAYTQSADYATIFLKKIAITPEITKQRFFVYLFEKAFNQNIENNSQRFYDFFNSLKDKDKIEFIQSNQVRAFLQKNLINDAKYKNITIPELIKNLPEERYQFVYNLLWTTVSNSTASRILIKDKTMARDLITALKGSDVRKQITLFAQVGLLAQDRIDSDILYDCLSTLPKEDKVKLFSEDGFKQALNRYPDVYAKVSVDLLVDSINKSEPSAISKVLSEGTNKIAYESGILNNGQDTQYTASSLLEVIKGVEASKKMPFIWHVLNKDGPDFEVNLKKYEKQLAEWLIALSPEQQAEFLASIPQGVIDVTHASLCCDFLKNQVSIKNEARTILELNDFTKILSLASKDTKKFSSIAADFLKNMILGVGFPESASILSAVINNTTIFENMDEKIFSDYCKSLAPNTLDFLLQGEMINHVSQYASKNIILIINALNPTQRLAYINSLLNADFKKHSQEAFNWLNEIPPGDQIALLNTIRESGDDKVKAQVDRELFIIELKQGKNFGEGEYNKYIKGSENFNTANNLLSILDKIPPEHRLTFLGNPQVSNFIKNTTLSGEQYNRLLNSIPANDKFKYAQDNVKWNAIDSNQFDKILEAIPNYTDKMKVIDFYKKIDESNRLIKNEDLGEIERDIKVIEDKNVDNLIAGVNSENISDAKKIDISFLNVKRVGDLVKKLGFADAHKFINQTSGDENRKVKVLSDLQNKYPNEHLKSLDDVAKINFIHNQLERTEVNPISFYNSLDTTTQTLCKSNIINEFWSKIEKQGAPKKSNFVFDNTAAKNLKLIAEQAAGQSTAFRAKSPESIAVATLVSNYLRDKQDLSASQKVELYYIMKPYMETEADKGRALFGTKTRAFATKVNTLWVKLKTEVEAPRGKPNENMASFAKNLDPEIATRHTTDFTNTVKATAVFKK